MVDGRRLRVGVRVDAVGAHFKSCDTASKIFVIVFGWESLSQHSGSAEEVHAHSSHAHTHTTSVPEEALNLSAFHMVARSRAIRHFSG